MILITTAMMLEARPIVERLALCALGNEPYRAFSGDAFLLVVTGTGSLRASCATGWALGRFPEIRAAVNIGFCGAAPGVASLYQWNYIETIRDSATGRMSVPDILWKHNFPETGLLTVPAVMDSPKEEERVVDMEGSGFFEAARQFLPPDRIALLKWVSDPLSAHINLEETEKAYAKFLTPVIEFLESWPVGSATGEPDVSGEWYNAISNSIRLSESQSQYLKKWLRGYSSRGGDSGKLFACLPDNIPATKRENKEVFERLKDALKS